MSAAITEAPAYAGAFISFFFSLELSHLTLLSVKINSRTVTVLNNEISKPV